jgi:ATP-grasp domain
MKRVLITGGRAPVAVDLARSFAAAGAHVVVADSAPLFLARASRAVSKAVRVPPPRQEPRAFAAAIRAIAVGERIDLIVPTCEEVFYLGRFAAELRGVAELFCPDFPVLEELHDKERFTRVARGLGAEVPETWRLTTCDDLEGVAARVADLVFKPVFSRFAVHTLVRPTAEAARAITPTPARPWVAQRFVAGRELCSYAVARGGRLTAHALYEPTWRAGRGSGYYFQPMQRPAIEDFTARLVAKLNYTGQIAFDFIEAADGGVHVIECNPRATSGLHLFARDAALARAFDGSARAIVRPREDRVAMLGAAMVFIGGWQALRRWKIGRWMADGWRARDVLWSWRDPAPAFFVFAGLAATLVKAARVGISPQAASTRDIEWDGEEIPGP